MRRICVASLCLCLASCASQPQREQTQRLDSVDQRLLAPGGDGAISAYAMQPQQVFRMPQPLDAATPQLPADSPRRTLAPTTVCVRVVLSAQGTVQRSEPLHDREECGAGVLADNADLLQAVQQEVARWRFVPAAICTYADPAQRPAVEGRCDDAVSVEEVPVTLAYAFTFEVREGKASVQAGRVGGRGGR
ncbi:hypothetical protein A6R71_16150 [Xanthomonas translucens pv. arrhenatheri]|uniref:Uncharacterized protein n=1 Tax=Xanthomonas graminis pv. arrhenatheri LMG 727 TaxID=1195923 RepID=A0A0K2ZX23_9XANT|nr:hypothetical protein [Xanthomonas translucens]OAX67187.1 hypothetical protein A6R71_16150 [Xanthomonas translucens pv. arrhenatheri]UKE76753.1 hypothetical protein KM317_14995 [Xanthomonas translucens pv. arrhenatheri]CTP87870.1 hypothetical protein XTALMG727_2183 [Xanthomonas translucens pv. arrhenatheri LMG 727]